MIIVLLFFFRHFFQKICYLFQEFSDTNKACYCIRENIGIQDNMLDSYKILCAFLFKVSGY